MGLDNHIPESAVTAIRQKGSSGLCLLPATSKAEIPPEIWDIGFDSSYVGMRGRLFCQLIPRMSLKVSRLASERRLSLPRVITVSLRSRGFREAARPVLRTTSLKGVNQKKVVNMEAEEALHGLVYDRGALSGHDLDKVSFILRLPRPSGL